MTQEIDNARERERIERERRDALRDIYSHTSRVWNSSVTIAIAGAALSVTLMLSGFFGAMCIYSRSLLGIFLWTGVTFGLVRVVEMGYQLQFLESEIRVSVGSTLLEYINNDIPRIRLKRLTQDEAQAMRRKKVGLMQFAIQHWVALVAWTIFVIVMIVFG